MATCRFCAEEIKDEARVCPHCRKNLVTPSWHKTAIVVGTCLALFGAWVGWPHIAKMWSGESEEARVERSIRDALTVRGFTVERVEMKYIGAGEMRGSARGVKSGEMVSYACKASNGKWSCD